MKKLPNCLAPLLFLCLFSTLGAQTLSTKLLPAKTQKALKDFVPIEGGTFVKGNFGGSDSLNYSLPLRVDVKSFYLYRFEISVEEYQEFAAVTDRINHYDSTIWMVDYPYGYNEPMVLNYFWHPAYRQNPVIGITWDQAVRYCAWKTEQLNEGLEKSPYRITVRLPKEDEWEYAALGSQNRTKSENERIRGPRFYPWEGLFLLSEKDGGFRTNCNSGPLRTPEQLTILGFQSDGFLYTAPVKSFQPNEAGLYQMAGNVAEWTSDNYSTLVDRFQAFLDEHEDDLSTKPEVLNQIKSALHEPYKDYKIVKGGSWVDGPFYTQSGVIKVQAPGRASSTTGFRPALVIEQK